MRFLKKKEKEEFIDDGRTIADMNVDGMPWSMKDSPDAMPRSNDATGPAGGSSSGQAHQPYQMTKEEGRAYTWAAIKAGLIVALIFGLVYFFLILFMDKVWFGN